MPYKFDIHPTKKKKKIIYLSLKRLFGHLIIRHNFITSEISYSILISDKISKISILFTVYFFVLRVYVFFFMVKIMHANYLITILEKFLK